MAQNIEAIRILIALAAIMIVAFWRSVIRYVISLVAITILVTLGYGAVMLWQTVHHSAG
jgi:hypothetical protein